LTKEALAQIFQGQRTVRETFAGPLRIAEISGQAAQQGARDLFMWMSILSLSLGVFNLFPIPVLDGGLIFMLGLEWLMGLTGRQLSVSLREKIQTVGLAIIVILMGYIIYSDFATRFSSRPQTVNQQPAAQQPAPANK
jgi:regulator of sigma E protease